MVKILIVTDSSGGFDESIGFHLGQVIKILADDTWSFVRFEVTKVHRQLQYFTFKEENLSDYDQIWLFGIENAGNPLSEPELRALARFMDGIKPDGTDERGGGGVIATGDHENLGEALCAKVPRVRSMRRWYHPNPGPNGEPIAPDQYGSERHDSLVGPAADQSDGVAQVIRPIPYLRQAPGPTLARRVAQVIRPIPYSRSSRHGVIIRVTSYPTLFYVVLTG